MSATTTYELEKCENENNESNVRCAKMSSLNFFLYVCIFLWKKILRRKFFSCYSKFSFSENLARERDRRIWNSSSSNALSSSSSKSMRSSYMTLKSFSSFSIWSSRWSREKKKKKIRKRTLRKMFRNERIKMNRKRATSLLIRLRFSISNVIRLRDANCLNLNASLSLFFLTTTTLFLFKMKVNLMSTNIIATTRKITKSNLNWIERDITQKSVRKSKNWDLLHQEFDAKIFTIDFCKYCKRKKNERWKMKEIKQWFSI